MRKKADWVALGITAAIAFCLALPAQAVVSVEGEGVVRLFCSDQEGATHPKRVELMHSIALPEGASFDITGMAAIYEPDASGPSGETMSVRVQVLKADGGSVALGRMSATRDAAGEVEAEKEVAPVTVENGDMIRWRFKFRNFGQLGSESLGDCFVLFVLAGTIPE